MIGSMSAMSTDLPRMRAATAIEIVDSGASPVPLSINTRTNATICSATKKKIVGGIIARNSSLILSDSLLMAFQSLNAAFRPLARTARPKSMLISTESRSLGHWLRHCSMSLPAPYFSASFKSANRFCRIAFLAAVFCSGVIASHLAFAASC